MMNSLDPGLMTIIGFVIGGAVGSIAGHIRNQKKLAMLKLQNKALYVGLQALHEILTFKEMAGKNNSQTPKAPPTTEYLKKI